VVVETFNKQFAVNKRVKVKALQEGMQFAEEEFMSIEECTRPA
jgi:hypothetical protein